MAAVVMMVVVGGNCEDTTPGAMRRRPSFLPPTQSQYSPTHRAPLRPVPPPQVRTGSAQSAMSIKSTPIQSSRVPRSVRNVLQAPASSLLTDHTQRQWRAAA